MKNIKNFEEFLNEELKHLPPPSDDETLSIPAQKRIELIKYGKLDKKFYPSEKEIDEFLNEMKPEDALSWSVENKLINFVKKYIERGVDINIKSKNGWTALHFAAAFNNLVLVKYLIKQGADINIKSKNGWWTPLTFASRYGYVDIVKFLLEHGANVNIEDKDGKNIITLVLESDEISENKKLKIVDLLKKYGTK